MSVALTKFEEQFVSRETLPKLREFLDLLIDENQRQNLISPLGYADAWTRHVIDGAQLARLGNEGRWVDIGSGGGLPGLVIGIVSGQPITLVEPRKLRADFLQRTVHRLALDRVDVVCGKAENVAGSFDTITARAVAPLDKLLGMTLHLAHNETKWVLPKGKSAKSELDEALRKWHGDFQLVESATNSEAAIVVASRVRPRGNR